MVARIFSEFTAGHRLYAITESLTRDGIPAPSAHDRARTPASRIPATVPRRESTGA